MLTHDRLKELVHYCPTSGRFTRLQCLQKSLLGKEAGWIYNGYIYLRVDSKTYKAHRLAHFYMTGNWPAGCIDHINGDRADNRWTNIRVVSYRENAENQPLYRNNTSGVSGVKYKKSANRWEVYIGNTPRHYIGSSKDWFDAVCMRKSAESSMGYHQNHGRQP